jgi:hypothetical protein
MSHNPIGLHGLLWDSFTFMTVQCCDCMSQRKVYKWVRGFKVRRMNIGDMRVKSKLINVSETTGKSLLMEWYIILV